MSADRPLILHLAVDYNTPQRKPTTHAIEWFLDALPMFDHVVVAYRRVARPGPMPVTAFVQDGRPTYDFPFFGLPLGVGLHAAMRRAATRTIRQLERDGVRPDAVHAHKLTFDGLAGWYVARHFGVPLFVSLRGEVESKVFRAKPALRPFLRRVCRDAAALYFVSAWYERPFRRLVPGVEAKMRRLPNIVRNIRPVVHPAPPGPAFVSVLNLDTWRRKGLAWLLDGFARAAAERPDLRLDIIGGGSAESQARAVAMVAAHRLQDKVTLVGAIPNAELLARLPGYRGLLLPSLNETFGMVYLEALFAGLPVLFTRDTGIDGYLDGLEVGRTVGPRSAADVAAAILALDSDAEGWRVRIAAAAPELARRFDPGTHIAAYAADVRAAIAQS